MLTELHNKGGSLCEPARRGELRCPLLVRSSSEDVITGELIQVLRALNPRWWLADFLNTALGAERFPRQVYRGLRIAPWVNHRPYPRELLPWTEGSTQVDVEISWENPPTTVFIEAKYQSELGKTTSNSGDHSEFGTDQLIRNVRVGLHHCGYFAQGRLFETPPRDFVVLLLSPSPESYLVKRYRNEVRLRQAIPRSDQLTGLPRMPFVGEIGYAEINDVLRRRMRFFTRAERIIVDHLTNYLDFKKAAMRSKLPYLQELGSRTSRGHGAGIQDRSNRKETEHGEQERRHDQECPSS
jgi:hypothetical protein